MLCLVALLTLLTLWTVSFGGAGGSGDGANGNSGHTPASSITPGPSASGPLNSSRPGGSVGGSSGGSSSGGSGETGATDGSSSGSTSSPDTGDGGTTSGATSGGTSGGGQLPAGSTLPDCTSSGVTLTLRSAKNAYEPGEKPELRLTAHNANGTACKLDFGPKAAVLTITDVDDNHVWATDDCPVDKSAYLLQVPAGSSTTHLVQWGGMTSSPDCATPRGAKAPTGTYLVEAKLPGFAAKQTSFVLKNA